MKLSTSTTAAVAAASTLFTQATAHPQLFKRQRAYGEAASALIELFAKLFNADFFDTTYAWDVAQNPQMCSVKMETVDGGNCAAFVTCADGVTKEYKHWNVCFVGGRQYFTDERMGDFSITFTQVDGTEGEGLTDPILQLANVENWREIPVSDLAQGALQAEECKKGGFSSDCQGGPFVCHYGDTGNDYIYDSRAKRFECGMPSTGKGGPEGTGLDSNAPTNELGYAPGWCVAHVTQYQKPDPAVDSYGLEAVIYDNNENEIGNSGGRQGATLSLASKLPYTLEITTLAIDTDPINFAYEGQSWNSYEYPRCGEYGDYDNGARQIDCGFTC